MTAHPGEKILAAELVATMAFAWVAEIFRNRQTVGSDPLGAAPKPQVFLPQIGAYAALGLVALFGPEPARFAAGLGGLVALVVILKAAGAIFSTSTRSSSSSSSSSPAPGLFSRPTQGVTAV